MQQFICPINEFSEVNTVEKYALVWEAEDTAA